MVAEVLLVLEPQETCIVSVQSKGLVKEIGAQHLEGMDHRQQLQEMQLVQPLGRRQLARLEHDWVVCARMAETASSDESVSRRVGSGGSHTSRTGAKTNATLSASKLVCSAGPQRTKARGLQRAVSGAAKAEKRRTNLWW